MPALDSRLLVGAPLSLASTQLQINAVLLQLLQSGLSPCQILFWMDQDLGQVRKLVGDLALLPRTPAPATHSIPQSSSRSPRSTNPAAAPELSTSPKSGSLPEVQAPLLNAINKRCPAQLQCQEFTKPMALSESAGPTCITFSSKGTPLPNVMKKPQRRTQAQAPQNELMPPGAHGPFMRSVRTLNGKLKFKSYSPRGPLSHSNDATPAPPEKIRRHYYNVRFKPVDPQLAVQLRSLRVPTKKSLKRGND